MSDLSGYELEIAGPDYERETDEPCTELAPAGSRPQADARCDGRMIEQGYRGSRWKVCSECGYYVNLPSLDRGKTQNRYVETGEA